jgi:hypothetical protein
MLIQNVREWYTGYSTIGSWIIGGKFFCYVLEDTDRQRLSDGTIIPWNVNLKIPKETAIPYGHYEIITNHSNRFKRVMPLIVGVPDFSGIRIHNGNTTKNTEGCPLLGYTKDVNWVGRSNDAFDDFMVILINALEVGKVHLDIIRK